MSNNKVIYSTYFLDLLGVQIYFVTAPLGLRPPLLKWQLFQ